MTTVVARLASVVQGAVKLVADASLVPCCEHCGKASWHLERRVDPTGGFIADTYLCRSCRVLHYDE